MVIVFILIKFELHYQNLQKSTLLLKNLRRFLKNKTVVQNFVILIIILFTVKSSFNRVALNN